MALKRGGRGGGGGAAPTNLSFRARAAPCLVTVNLLHQGTAQNVMPALRTALGCHGLALWQLNPAACESIHLQTSYFVIAGQLLNKGTQLYNSVQD